MRFDALRGPLDRLERLSRNGIGGASGNVTGRTDRRTDDDGTTEARRRGDDQPGSRGTMTDDRMDPNERSGQGGRSDRDGRSTDPTTVRATNRWRGIVAVVLLAAAVGILAKRPSLLLVAAVGVAFAAYPRLTSAPDPELSIGRKLESTTVDDGDTVVVRTTVRNEGKDALFDLRVIDGVPATLPVSSGSPRCAAALKPGAEVTLEYELCVRRGRHRFGPTTLLCRDVSGSVEVETTATAADEIDCAARVPTVPLRASSRHRTGPLVTEAGGHGLEFHSTDEYTRGDPASRIDWRRYARTGELTSVRFHAERLADVVICVDARADAYRASSPNEPHAVAHAVDAADRIAEGLFDAGHRVGLAAFGRDSCLLSPESGREHADRFRRRLVTEPALTLLPPESVRANRSLPSSAALTDVDPAEPLDRQLATIRARIGSNTQVILLTPLCDEEAPRIAQRFESEGSNVIAVSPDVTTDRTDGGRLARLERGYRIRTLRNAGIPVVDWDPDDSLGAALSTVGGWDG